MPCQNDRAYLTDSSANKPVPDVPKNQNDWLGLQRLLQHLWEDAQKIKPNTLTQPALLNTPRTGALPIPADLTASGAGPIALNWSAYPQTYLEALSFFKVYRSITNNLDTASIIGVINGTRFVDSDIVVAATYYYWVAGVTKDGIEGTPATASASFSGFPTTYLADLSVTAAKIANLTITTTKISDNSISTPKLQALSVVAAKIDVGQLSAISADLGTITAGTVTGATIRTASGNPRVELNSTGFHAYNGAGTEVTSIRSDASIGYMVTDSIMGRTTTLALYNVDGSNQSLINIASGKIEFSVQIGTTGEILQLDANSADFKAGIDIRIAGTPVIDASGIFVGPSINIAGSITVGSGQGITNGSGNDSLAIAANEIQAYVNSTLVGKFDGTSDATNTNFYYYRNGALRQAKVVAGALMEA